MISAAGRLSVLTVVLGFAALFASSQARAQANPVAGTNQAGLHAGHPFPPALFARPWQRKALVTGPGTESNGTLSHPGVARAVFLRLVGNPDNDPRKGWTCDMSWDLMVKAGMNPTNASLEELFRYIGTHQLGYRIVINNVSNGQASPAWDDALENGMMAFAPHYDNTPGYRFDDPIGIKSAVSVGGGGEKGNLLTYGQSLEFHDALPTGGNGNTFEDAAQSWANQVVAAKFARILDAHRDYNIWDAREHLRQAANRWVDGWTEQQGYGWVNEKAVVTRLEPGAPVAFSASLARDRHGVVFSWRNFLMTDFAATVIAKANGQVLYEGTGTEFVWPTDTDGEMTFRYWSKNKAGGRSRVESAHTRAVAGLFRKDRNYTALVLGAPLASDFLSEVVRQRFGSLTTNWLCDVVVNASNSYFAAATNLPSGAVVAVKSNYATMVDYAIARQYRLAIVPNLPWLRVDLAQFRADWDRATAAGILVVLPHESFIDLEKRSVRNTPTRLGSAVSVGPAADTDRRASGPGLEFVDETVNSGPFTMTNDPNSAVGMVAAKLARLLEANPGYNPWDARQHLRQVSSHYAAGWQEKGGYGQPPAGPPPALTRLDLAPPLGFAATRSEDGGTVTFSWELFPQSDFAEVVLRKEGGAELYHGAGTNFVWRNDTPGEATFTLQARGKSGARSRIESYCRVRVPRVPSQ